MRGKASNIQVEEDKYGFVRSDFKTTAKARLDLNDLLKRAKDEKKVERKINLLILSGVSSAVLVCLLIFSL